MKLAKHGGSGVSPGNDQPRYFLRGTGRSNAQVSGYLPHTLKEKSAITVLVVVLSMIDNWKQILTKVSRRFRL
jgi:hypothetical protein